MRLWRVEDVEPRISTPNVVIVPITYGSSRSALALATRKALEDAASLSRIYRHAHIAYAMPDNCYPGSASVEHEMKLQFLLSHGVSGARVLWGEHSINSITEAEAVHKLAYDHQVKVDVVIVICTAMHSRSLRYTWRHLFPHTPIVIQCLPGFPEIELNHQMLLQRSRWVCFLANLARHATMRLLGIDFARRVGSPGTG